MARTLPFDKSKIFPYAYRHTYAQRHSDAGVPVDVLQQLMDHEQLAPTQQYYRAGEGHRREPVERVTRMRFDRHGDRVRRRARALLDTEHLRRAVAKPLAPTASAANRPTSPRTAGLPRAIPPCRMRPLPHRRPPSGERTSGVV